MSTAARSREADPQGSDSRGRRGVRACRQAGQVRLCDLGDPHARISIVPVLLAIGVTPILNRHPIAVSGHELVSKAVQRALDTRGCLGDLGRPHHFHDSNVLRRERIWQTVKVFRLVRRGQRAMGGDVLRMQRELAQSRAHSCAAWRNVMYALLRSRYKRSFRASSLCLRYRNRSLTIDPTAPTATPPRVKMPVKASGLNAPSCGRCSLLHRTRLVARRRQV